MRIANSINGEKILYDIFPIKMVERSGTSDSTATKNSIHQNGDSVKPDAKKSKADADFESFDAEDFFHILKMSKEERKNFVKLEQARACLEKALWAAGSERVETERKNVRYSLREQFSAEFDEWYANTPKHKRATDGGYFKIGKTSDTLKKIGVKDNNIYWRKQKIQAILEDHPEITPEIIKDIPSIVESPVIVMKSRTRDDSITMLSDIEVNGIPVLVALQLNPIGAGKIEADFTLISSAYTKETGTKNLIKNSEILYLAEKKRAETLLMSLRVQFPSDQQAYDSLYGSISYEGKNVNISGKKIFSSGTIKPDAKKSKSDADFESFSAEDFFREAAARSVSEVVGESEKSTKSPEAPRATKKRGLSEGQAKKLEANYVNHKTFSRKEVAEVVDSITRKHLDFGEDYGVLIGKGRQEAIDALFVNLNTPGADHQQRAGEMIADLILENAIVKNMILHF